MKVLNDFISVIDSKEYCVVLFLDLSKAFDTVDHYVLAQRLVNIGMSPKAVKWFSNYLSGRTQSVQVDGVSSNQWWSVTNTTTSLLYLSTFFKYLYFTGVVLFWVTFTFTSLHSKA